MRGWRRSCGIRTSGSRSSDEVKIRKDIGFVVRRVTNRVSFHELFIDNLLTYTDGGRVCTMSVVTTTTRTPDQTSEERTWRVEGSTNV